ncbi:uncharacterized protein [Physcomitrium patens]|uniref:uncharacterized protein isoform X1 n=1 Tax=Physcomitrium patens TaxID=3218 RepID=UPI003CCDED09
MEKHAFAPETRRSRRDIFSLSKGEPTQTDEFKMEEVINLGKCCEVNELKADTWKGLINSFKVQRESHAIRKIRLCNALGFLKTLCSSAMTYQYILVSDSFIEPKREFDFDTGVQRSAEDLQYFE